MSNTTTTPARPVGSSARDRHPLPTKSLFDPAIVRRGIDRPSVKLIRAANGTRNLGDVRHV